MRIACNSGLLAPVTLLKVGHHGSRTSTTPDFLAAARAPGRHHLRRPAATPSAIPGREIIERLAEAHAHVFRTDQFGLTTFLLSRDGKISALEPASDP